MTESTVTWHKSQEHILKNAEILVDSICWLALTYECGSVRYQIDSEDALEYINLDNHYGRFVRVERDPQTEKIKVTPLQRSARH